MRLLDALLIATLALAECERAPPEGARRSTSPPAEVLNGKAVEPAARSAHADIRSENDPSRCVAPTPASPPPDVPRGPSPNCPQDPEPDHAKPVITRVRFPEASGATVAAEVVRSERDTTRGLMYRTSLGEENGMLFDLQVRGDHQFWMHNTCIPLDLLYIDADGLIVGIVENAPTLSDESRGVGCPSRWVLEVNAGWSRRHGVRAGQTLVLGA